MSKPGWKDSSSCWIASFGSAPAISFLTASVGQPINCLLAKPSLKKQTAGWLLPRCEWEQRAKTGERITEEAPRGPHRDPHVYHTTVGSVIPHTLRHKVERNSQTQKQRKLQ